MQGQGFQIHWIQTNSVQVMIFTIIPVQGIGNINVISRYLILLPNVDDRKKICFKLKCYKPFEFSETQVDFNERNRQTASDIFVVFDTVLIIVCN